MIIVTGAVRFGNGEIERLRSALVNAVEATRKEAGCAGLQLCGRPARSQPAARSANCGSDEAAVDAHMKHDCPS